MFDNIWVMIPTYQEKENIVELIKKIKKTLPCEILVVDDNSPDRTWELAENTGVNVLRRMHNPGRGTSGVEGFQYALKQGAEVIIEMDADFSHNPMDIPPLICKLHTGYDLVLGSRKVEGGVEVNRPAYRKLITTLANFYIRTLLGIKVRDCNSGFRVWHKRVFDKLDLNKVVAKGPDIVQELLYKTHVLGFKITEVGVTFTDRTKGESNLTFSKVFRGYVGVIKLKLKHLTGKL